MLQVLRIRDFRLLWVGSLISSLGSWLLTLAIPAHVFLVTGSLRDTGLTLAAEYLPLLVLGPVAGVVTDRWDRRRLMIGTNLIGAAAVTVMLAGLSPGRYWVLYVALIAESSAGVLYAPAWQARIPAIVGTGPMLSSANSLSSVSAGAVRLIGGPLGGVLLATYGAKWLICADALSYLVSAAAVFLTSRSGDEHPGRRTTIADVTHDLADGLRVLRRQPVARALLPVTVIALAANASLSAVLIAFGVDRLGGSEHTGFLLSGLGVGFLISAPVLRLLLDRVQPRHLLAASLAGNAAAYFALFTSSSLATGLPAAVAIGAFGSMSLVIPQTAMQRVIPDAVLGRVSAVFLTGEAAATLFGAAAGPFLAQAAGFTRLALVVSLVTLAAAALAWLIVPGMPLVSPVQRAASKFGPVTAQPHQPPAIPPALVAAFAPSGTLRASINVGNPILARHDPAGGEPSGVSVDLAREFARRLGVPVKFTEFGKASASVDAVRGERADIGFFAIDPARSEGLLFTAPYVLIEGSYLVPESSALTDNLQVDADGHRVSVGSGSAYDLFLTRELRRAGIVRLPGAGPALAAVRGGGAEVAAGIRQVLEEEARRAPGVRVLPGCFMVIRQAMGLPASRGADAQALLAAFVEDMKASGFVAEALRRHRIQGGTVAPAA
jgi:ABC-type amino acid transport substrate-binding protein